MRRLSLLLIILLVTLVSSSVMGNPPPANEKNRLAVLWTSGDPAVAHRVAFMYTHVAKTAGWFDEVVMIIWGPSQRILVGDKDLQAKVKAMQDDGIKVMACIFCAKTFGVVEQLEALGLPVEPMGVPLSDYIKSDDWDVITF
ncbi:MAG: DsrE family protein [Candidatus Neomarinimicrobiota bacterium]